MGNEKSRLTKKNRSASVDIAAKNLNTSIQSSFLDTSALITEKDNAKRETLPDNLQIKAFMRRRGDFKCEEIKNSLDFVHEVIVQHEIYMLNSSLENISGMTADISRQAKDNSNKKEISFQGNFFTENSLFANIWQSENRLEPTGNKTPNNTIEPELIIHFGNILQNRASQNQKNINLEIQEDPPMHYKNILSSVLQETPIFSEKKPDDLPQRQSPKFIISPGQEEKEREDDLKEFTVENLTSELTKENQNKREMIVDSNTRKDNESNFRMPKDRVTFGFKDNSSTDVNTFEPIMEPSNSSVKLVFQPFLEQAEIPNKPQYEFSKRGDQIFGKPLNRVLDNNNPVVPDRKSFIRTASEKTLNTGLKPSMPFNKFEPNPLINSGKFSIKEPIEKPSFEEKKQIVMKNKSIAQAKPANNERIKPNTLSGYGTQSLADFHNQNKGSAIRDYGNNVPPTKQTIISGKKPIMSSTVREKGSGIHGAKAQEENVIKVNLHGRKKSNQSAKDSKQSSISSAKDVRITSMKINFDDNAYTKADEKLGKYKILTEIGEKNGKAKKGQANNNRVNSNNRSLLDSEGREHSEKNNNKARSVSPFTPQKKSLDNSQINISSIKFTNENSFHKESLDDIRKSLGSSSEKRDILSANPNDDLEKVKKYKAQESPIYTSDENDSDENSHIHNNFEEPLFKETGSEKEEEEPLHLKISLDVGKFKKNTSLANSQNQNKFGILPSDKNKHTTVRESVEADKLLKSVKEDIEKLTQKMSSQNYFSSNEMSDDCYNNAKNEENSAERFQVGDFRKIKVGSQVGVRRDQLK